MNPLRRICDFGHKLKYIALNSIPKLRSSIFAHKSRGTKLNFYLDCIYSLEKLEKSGTIVFDIKRPGFVVTMEYFTLWNRSFEHYGDDRVLHAWCDKIRALINTRRGLAYGSAGERLPILHPKEMLYITIADPTDPSTPFAAGWETSTAARFTIIDHTKLEKQTTKNKNVSQKFASD